VQHSRAQAARRRRAQEAAAPAGAGQTPEPDAPPLGGEETT